MNARILVVDDEKKLVSLIKAYLEKEGYQVATAFDGRSALEAWKREAPDLIVLDILLPQMDGYDFCREIRQKADTPIIMLSAKSEETDKLIGLELGADDYMTKPFSLRELTARIKAILRRDTRRSESEEGIVRGSLTIWPAMHRVELVDSKVDLTATEFKLLEVMARNPGQVFSRQRLMELGQGDTFEAYERTVDAHIKNIRKKLRGKEDGWDDIETVHGVGYRFKNV